MLSCDAVTAVQHGCNDARDDEDVTDEDERDDFHRADWSLNDLVVFHRLPFG